MGSRRCSMCHCCTTPDVPLQQHAAVQCFPVQLYILNDPRHVGHGAPVHQGKDAWSFCDHVELADQHLSMAGRRPRYCFHAVEHMKHPKNAAAHYGRHMFPLRNTQCITLRRAVHLGTRRNIDRNACSVTEITHQRLKYPACFPGCQPVFSMVGNVWITAGSPWCIDCCSPRRFFFG